MKYRATLNLSTLTKFLTNFNRLEASNETQILIESPQGCKNFTIMLTPKGTSTTLLPDDFRDGMFRTWGWSEKFTQI
jgi:hypothetical protein